MATPMISIVVPFFNVDTYVKPCLDSLSSQTFSDFEIVCVDDGSTDQTAVELYKASETDSRIKIVRKQNGGLSDARNYGVSKSAGDYVSFVDGDDIVSPYYLESLVNAMNKYDCKLAIGGFIPVNLSRIDKMAALWEKPVRLTFLDKERAVERILYGNPMLSACAHLAPKDLYLRHPFPKGLLYEDSLVFGHHVMPFESLAVVEEPIYGYVRREGSIVNTDMISFHQANEQIQAIEYLNQIIKKELPQLSKARRYHNTLELSRIYRKMPDASGDDRLNTLKYGIRRTIKRRLPAILLDGNVDVKQKARFALLSAFPGLYNRVFDFYINQSSPF